MDQKACDAIYADPDVLVIPFLKAARECNLGITMLVRKPADGDIEKRLIKTNRGPEGMAEDLGWTMAVDDKSVRAAASAMMNALALPGFRKFEALNEANKRKVIDAVRMGFAAAAAARAGSSKAPVPPAIVS